MHCILFLIGPCSHPTRRLLFLLSSVQYLMKNQQAWCLPSRMSRLQSLWSWSPQNFLTKLPCRQAIIRTLLGKSLCCEFWFITNAVLNEHLNTKWFPFALLSYISKLSVYLFFRKATCHKPVLPSLSQCASLVLIEHRIHDSGMHGVRLPFPLLPSLGKHRHLAKLIDMEFSALILLNPDYI